MKFKVESLTTKFAKPVELTSDEAKFIAQYLSRALGESLAVVRKEIEIETMDFEPVIENLETGRFND